MNQKPEAEIQTNQETKKVQVLLSAYNGETYLPAQLDSILSQKGVQVSVLVRDDGSKDRTLRILRRYVKKYENISVYAGSNLGTAKSFFDLLKHADSACHYYAFADQDDIWMKEKLACAASCLERLEQTYGTNLPLLYAGNVTWASKGLQMQKKINTRCNKQPSFGNALVENICMGCTQVFNRSLLELAASHPPKGNVIHDWWMYLTAACFGMVIYDRNAHMLYRQHEKNQIGMRKSQGARWKHRLLHVKSLRYKLSRQAVFFRDAYKGLLDLAVQEQYRKKDRKGSNARSLELLCGYRKDIKKKIQLVFGKYVCRQECLDDFAYRILFLLGYL